MAQIVNVNEIWTAAPMLINYLARTMNINVNGAMGGPRQQYIMSNQTE